MKHELDITREIFCMICPFSLMQYRVSKNKAISFFTYPVGLIIESLVYRSKKNERHMITLQDKGLKYLLFWHNFVSLLEFCRC